MFVNYIKVAIRNLGKHKAYPLINISGLAFRRIRSHGLLNLRQIPAKGYSL
jgi:hypothetical protein